MVEATHWIWRLDRFDLTGTRSPPWSTDVLRRPQPRRSRRTFELTRRAFFSSVSFGGAGAPGTLAACSVRNETLSGLRGAKTARLGGELGGRVVVKVEADAGGRGAKAANLAEASRADSGWASMSTPANLVLIDVGRSLPARVLVLAGTTGSGATKYGLAWRRASVREDDHLCLRNEPESRLYERELGVRGGERQ